MVTAVGAATASAVTGNVAVVPSEGIATLAGIWTAEGVSVASATVIPPRNAGLLNTMVPVSVSPLDHVCVFETRGILRLWMAGEGEAVTVLVMLVKAPLSVAVSVPVVAVLTGNAL
jgi:hypothetical protein